MHNINKDNQALVFEAIQEFEGLGNSLQKEFEYLMGLNAPEKDIQSKQRQIKALAYIGGLLNKIFNNTDTAYEMQEKTEMCLINFGVSFKEFKEFMQDSLPVIIEKAKSYKKEKSIQIPIVFRDMLYKEPETEIKQIELANKPVVDFVQLKKAAESNPGFLKSCINNLSVKLPK